MSRIHQALSKAAQERANQNKAATSADIMEITAQISSIASLEEKLEFVVPESAGPAVEDSAVQGLQTSFVNSGWELHPQFNTFSPGVKEKVGAERFRTLRSRLYQVAETKSLRRIMVTSSVPSEGKSFVCANLALAMAQQQNRRVLLIDADLRLPTLHKMLSVPRSPGLSNYLRGELDEHLAIQEGKQDNLFFMSAGDEAANPSELLMGDAMKRFMRFAAESFDWVIVDSPPTLPVHDPSLLADLCDGVLFVLRAGATDFELVSKATAEFRQKNLLGVIFNHVGKPESYGDHYYG